MDSTELRAAITWAPHYRPQWDADPHAYVEAGEVGWNKTRRLGKWDEPGTGFKAYVGVQHVDPGLAGWGVDAPEARFFVSWFIGRRCLGLRVAPTIPGALTILSAAYGPRAGR
jgi:hypothetical protein